jgi:ribosomal protein L11 methylase PrmA
MIISWRKYIEKRSTASHRPLLVEALKYVGHRGVALDFGAGSMNDSKYMLAEGFEHVIAMDSDDAAVTFAHQICNFKKNFMIL